MPETLPQPLRTTLALLPVSRGRGCHGSGSPECIEPSRSNRSAGRGAHHAGESLHMPASENSTDLGSGAAGPSGLSSEGRARCDRLQAALAEHAGGFMLAVAQAGFRGMFRLPIVRESPSKPEQWVSIRLLWPASGHQTFAGAKHVCGEGVSCVA